MGKQVTICNNCINKVDKAEKPIEDFCRTAIDNCCVIDMDKMPYCIIEETEVVDFVTGETTTKTVCCVPCREKNIDGNCHDYKQTHESRMAELSVPAR
jgi:hypothetical protein